MVASSQVGDSSVVRAVTKAEAAYLEIRARILNGSFAPGATLNQERLAAELGLSITPLREALRRLEGEGLVDLQAHRIVKVAPVSGRELADLCVVRRSLDPLAASLASQAALESERAEIVRFAAQSDVRTGDGNIAAHRAFHFAIYSATRNQTLEQVLGQLWSQMDRYRVVLARYPQFEKNTEAEHSRIADAIRLRDGALAAELMYEHVEATLRSVQRIAADWPDAGIRE